jgi:hypothetical protein
MVLQIINMQLTEIIQAHRGKEGPACLAESGWSAERMGRRISSLGKG